MAPASHMECLAPLQDPGEVQDGKVMLHSSPKLGCCLGETCSTVEEGAKRYMREET